ncbi:MAG: hypothetical protein HYR84_06820 [Planctomycetes bacterium]|nr:hypothetical protein [Planctomycetota bacterium]
MSITTTCPNCKVLFRLGDDLAGKKVKCQKCAHVFTVAAAEASPPPAPPDDDASANAVEDRSKTAAATKSGPPPSKKYDDDEDEDDKKKTSGPPPVSKKDAKPTPRGQAHDPGSKVGMVAMMIVGIGAVLVLCLSCGDGLGYWIYSSRNKEPVAANDTKDNKDGGSKKGDGKKDEPPPPGNFPPGGINIALGGDGTYRSDNRLLPTDSRDPLVGSPSKAYTIQLTQGEWYQIDMRSRNFDSYLFLIDIEKKFVVARDDDSGGYPDARIKWRANRTGYYRIHASSFGGGGQGDYMLFVRRIVNGKEIPPPEPPPPSKK